MRSPMESKCISGGPSRRKAPRLSGLGAASALTLQGRGRASLESLLRGRSVQLRRVLPELHERLPREPAPIPRDAVEERLALFEEVAHLLRNRANEGPVLLAIEDAHRSDVTSLRLLEFVAREIRLSPILLIVTYRDVEARADPARGPLFESLSALDPSGCVQLEGLAPSEVHALGASVRGESLDEAARDRLYRTTGGNPLFVHQVASLGGAPDRNRGLVQAVGIQAAIESHLSALSPGSREALTVASVLGSRFQPRHLVAVQRRSADEVEDDLLEGARARLVGFEGLDRETEFAHALVRDALYESLAPRRRRELHRRSAEVLKERRGEDPAYFAAIAHHQREAVDAADVSEAIEWLIRAAEAAVTSLAHEEAAEHYSRAVELDARSEVVDPERRTELSLRHLESSRFGSTEGLIALAGTTLGLARSRGDAPSAVRAVMALPPEFSPELRDAWQALHDAALEVVSKEDSASRALLLARSAFASLWAGRAEALYGSIRDVADLAKQDGDPLLTTLALNALLFVSPPENLEERLEASRWLQENASRCEDPFVAAIGLGCTVYPSVESGDVSSGRRAVVESVRIAEKHQISSHYLAYVALTNLDTLQGRLDDAERSARFARSLSRRVGRWVVDAMQVPLIPLRFEQGRLGELAEPMSKNAWGPLTDSGKALFLAHRGEQEAARAVLSRIDLDSIERCANWLGTHGRIAEAAWRVGDASRASSIYRRLEPYRDRIAWGSSIDCGGCVARELGLLSDLMDDAGLARAHLEHAVTVNDRIGAHYWATRSRLELSGLLERSGDTSAATELRAEAIAQARGLGMEVEKH